MIYLGVVSESVQVVALHKLCLPPTTYTIIILPPNSRVLLPPPYYTVYIYNTGCNYRGYKGGKGGLVYIA